jgi:hypothetical protein
MNTSQKLLVGQLFNTSGFNCYSVEFHESALSSEKSMTVKCTAESLYGRQIEALRQRLTSVKVELQSEILYVKDGKIALDFYCVLVP